MRTDQDYTTWTTGSGGTVTVPPLWDLEERGAEKLTTIALAKAASIDKDNHTIEFVANSGLTDRVGEALDVMGAELEHYLANPVFMWAHIHWEPPIGKVLSLVKDPDEGLIIKVQFAVEEREFAAEIWRLYEKGYLRAVSVCFLPKEHELVTDAADEDDGDDEKPELIWRVWELLEVSAVPIPCDPHALARGLESIRSSFGPVTSANQHERELAGLVLKALTKVNQERPEPPAEEAPEDTGSQERQFCPSGDPALDVAMLELIALACELLE